MQKTGKTTGFIGSGNMGEAMVGAMIGTDLVSPSMVIVSDIQKERRELMTSTYGIRTTEDNFRVVSQCEIIILAVKPQQMEQVLSAIARHPYFPVEGRRIFISIAAGYPLKKMEEILYKGMQENVCRRFPFVRVMPNTPALVLSGMSGMSPNRYATDEDIADTRRILESMGKVVMFPEDKLDAVTAVSGSGPAYVFYLMEAMIEAGIRTGLDPEDARILTMATVEGAVKLMAQRGESAKSLRRKVTSPGGTTEAAISVMEANHVKRHIVEGIEAAARRAGELSR